MHFIAHLRLLYTKMSKVSVPKSYVALVGLERYMKGRAKMSNGIRKVEQATGLMLRPDRAKAQKEEAKDRSQSARLEKEVVEEQEGAGFHKRAIKKLLGGEATAVARDESINRGNIKDGRIRSLTPESHSLVIPENVQSET